MSEQDKVVRLTGVSGVFCNEGKEDGKSRINIVLNYEDKGFTHKASLTLWESDSKDFIIDMLKALGFIGTIKDLMECNKDTDYNLLFPKFEEAPIGGVISTTESSSGKTYTNVVQVGNVVREATNKIDKNKFVQKFGFIDAEQPGLDSE